MSSLRCIFGHALKWAAPEEAMHTAMYHDFIIAFRTGEPMTFKYMAQVGTCERCGYVKIRRVC